MSGRAAAEVERRAGRATRQADRRARADILALEYLCRLLKARTARKH